jgi:hypothetical protein
LALHYQLSTINYQLISIMEDAKDTLKKLTAWDTAPALTDGEIDKLLENASLTDPNENHPSAPGWTPTYDLNSAASAGWLIKAGRASNVADPASKTFENCLTMARHYSSRITGTIRTALVSN